VKLPEWIFVHATADGALVNLAYADGPYAGYLVTIETGAPLADATYQIIEAQA
jgi:hypothetical protein